MRASGMDPLPPARVTYGTRIAEDDAMRVGSTPPEKFAASVAVAGRVGAGPRSWLVVPPVGTRSVRPSLSWAWPSPIGCASVAQPLF